MGSNTAHVTSAAFFYRAPGKLVVSKSPYPGGGACASAGRALGGDTGGGGSSSSPVAALPLLMSASTSRFLGRAEVRWSGPVWSTAVYTAVNQCKVIHSRYTYVKERDTPHVSEIEVAAGGRKEEADLCSPSTTPRQTNPRPGGGTGTWRQQPRSKPTSTGQ